MILIPLSLISDSKRGKKKKGKTDAAMFVSADEVFIIYQVQSDFLVYRQTAARLFSNVDLIYV